MTVYFEEETSDLPDFDYQKDIISVIKKACEQEKCPYEPEVSVTMTDNEQIKELNKQFREIDKATDVLSFPMVDYEAPADFSIMDDDVLAAEYFNPETSELMLGDIVISVERASQQALDYGHSLRREICFLTAHSMLHLFGYDHMVDDERIVMEERQNKILDSLGITRD